MPQAIDTSMYGTLVAPKTANPLQTMGSAASTINALNQNRLFQQQFGARQAIGEAYQKAIDPTTGQLDTNKLTSLVANDPRAAFMAGDVAQQALARKQAQLGVQSSQIDLALKHAKAMSGYFGGLLSNPNPTFKDVTTAATEMVAEGLVSPQQAAAEFANVPDDAAGIKQWAMQHYARYQGMQGQLESVLPKPTAINTGGQTKFVDVNPLTNPGAASQSVPNTLSPADLASPVPAFDPVTKQPTTITRAQLLQRTGGGGLPPQMTGMPPSPAPSQVPPPAAQPAQPSPLGTGRMPAAAPNAAAPQPSAPGASSGVPSGPPLGAAEAASVTAHQSAQQGIDLQKAADSVPNQKAILGNLEADLQNFTSGPGADWTKVAKAWANRNNPIGNIFDPKSIASQEEFGKQAFQLAQQQFQTLGGTGTDSKLDSTMHTSPNDFLSKLGNEGIIHLLKGNADAIAVKNQEWQKWLAAGHGSETYGQFSTDFNKKFDPRVFQSQYMSPTEKQDMLKGMTAAEKTKFRSAYNTAVQDGWIADPRQNAGQ